MPSNTPTALVIIGGAAVLIALIGGGIKFAEFELPKLNDWIRGIAAIGGLLAIFLGVVIDPNANTPLIANLVAIPQVAQTTSQPAISPGSTVAGQQGVNGQPPVDPSKAQPQSSSTLTPAAPTDTPIPSVVHTETPTSVPVTPTVLHPIELITIEPSRDTSAKCCAPKTGTYALRYLEGEYSLFPNDEACGPKGCWDTAVFVTKHTSLADAVLADIFETTPEAGQTNQAFVIGKNDRVSTDGETELKPTEIKNIDLTAGECLMLSTTQGIVVLAIDGEPKGSVTLEITHLSEYICWGGCWLADDAAKTLTWTGPIDGSEAIWLSNHEMLGKLQNGSTAIFTTTVPLKISMCIGSIDGTAIAQTCIPTVVELKAGQHKVTSPGAPGWFRVGINP